MRLMRRSTRIANQPSQFEYQHLQSILRDNNKITTKNEYGNFINALEFISTQIHSDQMINDIILIQYSLKAGMKNFGHDSKKAVIKELNQMLIRKVFSEIDYNSLTDEDKRRALSILLYLSLKQDGKSVKGQACADGRP